MNVTNSGIHRVRNSGAQKCCTCKAREREKWEIWDNEAGSIWTSVGPARWMGVGPISVGERFPVSLRLSSLTVCLCTDNGEWVNYPLRRGAGTPHKGEWIIMNKWTDRFLLVIKKTTVSVSGSTDSNVQSMFHTESTTSISFF